MNRCLKDSHRQENFLGHSICLVSMSCVGILDLTSKFIDCFYPTAIIIDPMPLIEKQILFYILTIHMLIAQS